MALAKPETLGYRKSNAEEPETIESFIKMINSDNKTVQLEGALGIRKLLSIESKNKSTIFSSLWNGFVTLYRLYKGSN